MRFAYRCDRETSINAILEASILESARKGVRVHSDRLGEWDEPIAEDDEEEEPYLPDPPSPSAQPAPSSAAGSSGPIVAVPELTHPGESQSNGLSERAVQP